jgi:hypothetical protein
LIAYGWFTFIQFDGTNQYTNINILHVDALSFGGIDNLGVLNHQLIFGYVDDNDTHVNTNISQIPTNLQSTTQQLTYDSDITKYKGNERATVNQLEK